MIEIDKLFRLPKGVVDVRADEELFTNEPDWELEEETETDLGPVSETPSLPTEFEIVSQRIRTLPNGSSVVDVVISFPNQPDGTEFEVRIYKV